MTSPDTAESVDRPRQASATAQGSVCLHLGVGDRRPDGRHGLVTVTQSLDLTETVTLTVTGVFRAGAGTDAAGPVTAADVVSGSTVAGHGTVHGTVRDTSRGTVRDTAPGTADPTADHPADRTDGAPEDSPAVRGVLAVLDRYRRAAPGALLPQVSVNVDRGVPVTGGLGGAAADAAAALTAMREILHGSGAAEAGFALAPRPTDTELQALAADLGTAVPACLVGGTVLGTGAGTDLVPVMSRGTRHWALATDDRDLPATGVFDRLDDQRAAALRGERPDVRAGDVTGVQRALLTDNPTELAAVLANDLQAAVLSLRPELRRTLGAARESGALAAVVSGTGPTVAMLCSDRDHAVDVATAVAVAGHTGPTLVAASSSHGARAVR